MERVKPLVVSLYGNQYPLAQRPIVRRGITPFPQKIVTGDYRRSDHVVESEWVISDFTGGLGVLIADPTRHGDRYWFGTLDGRYRYLTLPPLVVSRGSLPSIVDRFQSYAGRLYAVAGGKLYRWEEGSGTWTNLGAFPGAFQDIVVYDGRLVILTDSGLSLWDAGSTSWTHVSGTGGFCLGVWDDKLFRLDLLNRMWWSIDPADANSWTAAGRFLAPPGHGRQLIPYFDAAGEIVLHLVAKDGVYAYDFAAQRFYPTGLQYPETDQVGRADVWRGELYVPVGLTVYKYNTNAVTMVGPDRDDGLPRHLSGSVQKVVAGHGLWFAVIAVSSVSSTRSTIEPGWPINDALFPGVDVTGAVLMSPGIAFHVLTQRTGITAMGDVAALTADGKYRLWGSDSAGIWSVDLPVGLHNPLQNPTVTFAQEGSLVTSWWDMGWSELEKLALGLDIDAVVPQGCEVSVYVGWDQTEDWEFVGTLRETGKQHFRLGGLPGKRFRSARVLIAMRRGSDPTAAPYLRSIVLTYLRTPRLLWGWELVLQLTDPYCREMVGIPAHELVQRLEEAASSRVAGTFRYYDEETGLIERRVFLTELVASEIQGSRREGRYTVSLIELES